MGAYWVEVAAVDAAGNGRSVRGEVVIPAPGEPAVTPLPTRTPTAQPTATSTAVREEWLPAAPAPSVTPGMVVFRSSNPPIPQSSDPQIPQSSDVVWGGAALALIAAATAAALEARRKRKEAEAQARAEAQAANAQAAAREEALRREAAWRAWQRKQAEAAVRQETTPANRPPEAQQAYWHGWREAQAWIAYGTQWRAQKAAESGLTWQERQRMVEWERRQRAQAAYQRYRQSERAEAQTIAQPKESLWKRVSNEGNDVIQNLATAIGAVEIARYARLQDRENPPKPDRRPMNTMWGEAIASAKRWNWGWERVQEKLEDMRGRMALKIQEVIEAGRGWRQELRAHWASFQGQAKMSWDALRRNGLRGLKVDAGDVVDFSGSVADVASAIGYAGYVVTGNEKWRTVGQWADVASVPAALKQIYDGIKGIQAMPSFPKITSIGKNISFLGKVAGPLAMVTGGFTFITGFKEAFDSYEKGDIRMVWANGLSAFSGAAAVVGGVALLIPGAQPVAAVALGLSAITGVASMAVEYWPTPTGATTPVDTSLRPPTPPISMPVQTGTPTPPPTSTPTLTSTPPVTSVPSQTPQVTQTPTPTQTKLGGN